jgi:hypothetical protein
MVLGVVLFLIGRFRSKHPNVHASSGSVAVGGNNSGQIINTNVGQRESRDLAGSTVTIVAMLVELVGIGLAVWHLTHS